MLLHALLCGELYYKLEVPVNSHISAESETEEVGDDFKSYILVEWRLQSQFKDDMELPKNHIFRQKSQNLPKPYWSSPGLLPINVKMSKFQCEFSDIMMSKCPCIAAMSP